jgi:Tol biopolymer transport system component
MIGKTVSHYKILSKIGGGGMGVVYKAQDLKLSRTVALKFLPPDLTRDEKAKRRFIQEAQAASAMEHSNICTIFEVDETVDGRMFICMAYYEGRSLKERIDEGELDLGEAVDIAIEIAQGLEKAHEQGIVHRDIKPGNVFMTDDGEVKIVDFGLAKLTGRTGLTSSGKTMGTVAYMSPEQGRGESVDERSDIWALGVVLYEMIAGRIPFKGEYDVAVMYSIMNEDPEPMADLRTGIPAELEQIVKKALTRMPDNRYGDVTEMLSDLRRLKKQMDFEEYTVTHPWRFDAKKRRILPAIVAAAAAVVVLVFVIRLMIDKEERPPGLPGQPGQVTFGDGWEGEPALSPDGERIAFTSDIAGNRDIYIVGIRGGNPMQLTIGPASDYYPAWFPDGTALVFVSDRSGKTSIWKIGQMGGGAMMLVDNAIDPAISPDGRFIAFSMPGTAGDHRIGVAPLTDPRSVKMLTGDEDGRWSHHMPAWSPDGGSICYATQDHLWIVPSSGGDARRLTTDGRIDADPVWSSDGEMIYFSSYRGGTLALWRVAAKGGMPERMTLGAGYEIEPDISPAGSRFVYATRITRCAIYVTDLESGKEVKLQGLRDDDYMVAIAPDGSAVVYASARGGNKIDLWLQPLEENVPSGPPWRLTDHQGDASQPVFSPDGKWLAYYRIIQGQRDIYTIPALGGRPIRITEDQAADITPAWSQDGSRLAFVSEREGGSHIWVAHVAEGMLKAPPRRITGEGVTAVAPVWSPGDSLIAFVGTKDDRNEVWVVPADGSGSARRLTTDANVIRIKWDNSRNEVLASGTWGGERCTLYRISLDGGVPEPVEPSVIFGSKTAFGTFDVSSDGRLLVYCQEDITGNIWILKSDDGSY